MYTPSHFTVSDEKRIHAFLQENSFGILVTALPGDAPVATHVPFLFDPAPGPHGRLCAHMARANPHWQDLQKLHEGVQEVLVIFQGTHSYVSPRFYEPGPAVPTWNYEAAHVYGVPSVMKSDAEARHLLHLLSAFHEKGAEHPWTMGKEPPAFIDDMVAGIVAFEIDITRVEMKAKLSQNKSPATQEKVIAALETSAHKSEQMLADIMRQRLADEED